MSLNVVIIGGGAAGFFSAFSVKKHNPTFKVIILEKYDKVLQKVKISGGGRCNVTHNNFDIKELTNFYPRGKKELISAFNQFMTIDTIYWFKERGVELKAEKDNRIFPITNKSETIINCFLSEMNKLNIDLIDNFNVIEIKKENEKFIITNIKEEKIYADKVIICLGGLKQNNDNALIKNLKINIKKIVPSLFTFNITENKIKDLAGISMPNVKLNIEKINLQMEGAILITHWGFSGPGILKLSSYGALKIADLNYNFELSISWVNNLNINIEIEKITKHKIEFNKNKIINSIYADIPKRLFVYLCEKINININKNWGDLNKEQLKKLVQILCNDKYLVQGKTTFKEEFVSCGGVDLEEINFKTMESKKHNGLYFAGEVLDIDGITGGFNFQAAWTTGFIAGKLNH